MFLHKKIVFIVLLTGTQYLGAFNYSITHYTSQNGLPQNSVRAIVQGKDGLIWIGTESGLVKFDGLRFKKIKAPPGKTVINAMNLDSMGRLWIKWFDYPSDIYNPKNNSWTELAIESKKAGEQIVKFYQYDEKFWVSGDNLPISYFDKNNQYNVLQHPVNEFIKNKNGNIIDFYKNLNMLYVAGYYGFFKINLLTNDFSFIPVNESGYRNSTRFITIGKKLYVCSHDGLYQVNQDTFSLNRVTPETEVKSCHSLNNQIYIHDGHEKAIFAYNTTTKTLSQPLAIEQSQLTKSVTIRSFRGKLLIILPNEILLFYGENLLKKYSIAHNQKFKYYHFAQLITGESGRDIENINIWLGTDAAGLFKISFNAKKFQNYQSPVLNTGLFRKAVSEGENIWLGSDLDGVYKWQRKDNKWTKYELPVNDRNKGQVRAIEKDPSGRIWAGAGSGELFYFDSTDNQFRLSSDLGGNQINTLLAVDELLYVGVNKELYQLNTVTNQFKIIDIRGFHVKAMSRTQNGNVLIGTHYAGVTLLDSDGKNLKFWGEDKLSSRNVFSLYEDVYGYIWVGTWGGGLNRINPKTEEVQVFNTENGLADNTIFGILPGQKGELWLSSYNGLMQFKGCINNSWPCVPIIRHFTEQDGLQGREFDAESYALLDTGELYFAGSNGFNVFFPEDLPKNTRPPEMLLTDIAVDGVWQYPITEFIELENDFTNLVLEFVALDFHNPKANRYQYRESATEDWIELDKPRIELSRLRSGAHHLHIRGSNNDGVWAQQPLAIAIQVKRPWYLSWIALIAYAMFITVIVMYWVNRREIFLKRQTKILEKKVKSRTQKLRMAYENQNKIYSSISHTTRTPLTNLLHPVNELKAGKAFNPEWTDMMIRQGTQLKNNIQNLIDISRLQSGEKIRWGAHEITPLLKSLQQDFQLQAGKKYIEILIDDQTNTLTAVKSYEQSLTIIMNNLLENAIKHTPENSHITITASEQKTHVVITVKDTGPGIKQEEIDQIFKYGQSNHKKLGWQPAGGIGLYTCANVAKALNGTLSAKNSAQGGAVFILKLPKADSSTKNRIEARESNKHTQRKSSQKVINSKNAENPQILLLDDNLDVLYTLSEQLQDYYQIITSTDAEKALTIIAEQIPDLIVSDVMMPQMNGFEFLQRIRSTSLTEDCPVIMLTAMDEKTAQLESLKLKADAVINKPHDKDRLLLTIENLLLKRTQTYFKAQLEFENYLLEKVGSQKPTNNIYQQIIEYLEENYHKTDLNVESLAKALNTSVATLNRKLKQVTHTKPLEIINAVRIKKANHFIKQGVDFINVAYDCGFSSQQAFNRVFKKVTKQTPNQYKKSLDAEN